MTTGMREKGINKMEWVEIGEWRGEIKGKFRDRMFGTDGVNIPDVKFAIGMQEVYSSTPVIYLRDESSLETYRQ